MGGPEAGVNYSSRSLEAKGFTSSRAWVDGVMGRISVDKWSIFRSLAAPVAHPLPIRLNRLTVRLVSTRCRIDRYP